MKATELITQAIQHINEQKSPWRDDLITELIVLLKVTAMHEDYHRNIFTTELSDVAKIAHAIPTSANGTALGHKPHQKVVAPQHVATDAALEVLNCSD